ncbi:DUF3078 domain-containing protein [Sanyastnella coralliicola]|uniref:DUF3078 domain-containing protein n=1 Tax=Sanyastnella coralliicola TaxID=3069118 RepID=UPI0027BA26F0|nr:DUF3078 domain-containing protein [Longitalea sp. SCSIO 12813]
MKKLLLSIALFSSVSLFAQDSLLSEPEKEKVFTALQQDDAAPADTSWKKGGTLGLNFSQVYLENWAAGGQSSLSGTALVNLFANYSKGKASWDNTLDLAYGLLRQGEEGVLIKTDDRIDFASKYGYKAGKKWYYSALLNFRTQFAPGYALVDGVPDESNIISDLLAPAYTLASLGMDYKPNNKFTAFISPATYKMTIVMNDSLADIGAFGVDPGENFRSEIGGYVRAAYNTAVVENVSFLTKIDLFSNYLNNPGNIDVNWEVLISMKINEFMNATVSTQLLYDDDIALQKKDEVFNDEGVLIDSGRGPGVQFKEVLAIGFSYKF